MRKTKVAALAAVVLVAVTAALATSVGSAGTTRTAQESKTCGFTLRIGDVLPFTGGLAAYGANLDRAVKVGIGLQNAALKQTGLSKQIKVKLVGSEDGQTQAAASVEATTKLVKSNHANVIIGEMASGATIPMAQSVTIPNHIVQISPTASAPQISDIADNGYLWRAYPSDTLQGTVLAQAVIDAFGKGATVNVGARNDAFGVALKQLFVTQFTKLGGKVGVNISWNPDQANFDSEMGQLVGGNPKGWVIIDFPETFQKYAASLVRTGKWDASRTFMTEALRNTTVLDAIGDPVIGLRGTAASAAGGPAGASFAAYWKKHVTGAKPYTGFEGTALDAVNVAFLAALRACSSSPAKIKANLVRVSGPPGVKVTYLQMAKAIKLIRAGKEVDYEGAFSPVDFDSHGDIGSAVFEIWKYSSAGKIDTLKTVTFRGSP
ncbi:MAG: branched-chain amino acid transport system substrate-binding protein [Gaiellaceae bacterium]|nr:branched-chain amino acid transport system substrate-binding protein [Gaiellaceae bacterium]